MQEASAGIICLVLPISQFEAHEQFLTSQIR